MKYKISWFHIDRVNTRLTKSVLLATLLVTCVVSCTPLPIESINEARPDNQSLEDVEQDRSRILSDNTRETVEDVERDDPHILPDDTREPIMAPIDIETAKDLALETAKSHPAIDFPPDFVSPAQLESRFFEDYYFVYVWGLWHHDVNSPFAVSYAGDVFKLPEEFNQLVQHRNLILTSSQEAQTLLEFFLALNIVWPGFDRHIILEDILDIPDIEEEVATQYFTVVVPLKISARQNSWEFEFFTWRSVGGVLFHWRAIISHAGEIEVIYREKLETEIGEYLLIE